MLKNLFPYARKLATIALLSGAGLGLMTLPAAAHASETAAALGMLEQIKSQMLVALETPAVRENNQNLRAVIDEILVPRVDFRAASQLVLGEHWKNATPEQRERFMHEFREFLVRFYSSAMTGYVSTSAVPDDFMSFDSQPLRQSANQMTLRSQITPPSGASIPVDYRLYKTDAWRVIDVSVRGMSMARNYRAGFDATIRSSGIDQLIADLKTKNAVLEP